MAPSVHKVIYKPDSQSTDEYIVIVDKTEVIISHDLLRYPFLHCNIAVHEMDRGR
jgi:hypothetical protein